MKVNLISNSFPNVNFGGTRNSAIYTISDETARHLLYDKMNADTYQLTLQNIKNSKKRISTDTLNTATHILVARIKYPGSYPDISPDKKLLSLLSHVKSTQPRDFNAVLKHLVECIAY